MPKRFNAVGCYIFAGGFTLGVQKHFNVLGHLEDGNYGVDTAKANIKNLQVETNPDKWIDFCDGKNIDFMYCNPPCAIFSTAGSKSNKGQGWKNDKRTQCWYNILELSLEVQPKVLAIESVTQALTKGHSILEEVVSKLGVTYKRIYLCLIDTLNMGLPQSRKRLFFIASKVDLTLRNMNSPQVTVGEVIDAVKDRGEVHNRNNEDKLIPYTRQGEKLRDVFYRRNKKLRKGKYGQVVGRPSFLMQRLQADTTMGAFIGNVFVHPTENRFLGINEMKALCGYPTDFELPGSISMNPRLLAQAVMPAAGRWLADQVSKSLRANKICRDHLKVHLVDLRKENALPKDVTNQYATYES